VADPHGSRLRSLSAQAVGEANSPQRLILEKELLHHEVLATLDEIGALNALVFKGGTCLRICHEGARFSEDLDFSGGSEFDPNMLDGLEVALQRRIERFFGVTVQVAGARLPEAEETTNPGDVCSWGIRVATEPRRPRGRAQRIKIDVDRRAYPNVVDAKPESVHGALTGPRGSFEVSAAPIDAILADKAVALAASIRDRRTPRYRDLWDLAWYGSKVDKPPDTDTLILRLSEDGEDSSLFDQSLSSMADIVASREFAQDMSRFLPAALFSKVFDDPKRRSAMAAAVYGTIERAKVLVETLESGGSNTL